jgi:hypothetical protein
MPAARTPSLKHEEESAMSHRIFLLGAALLAFGCATPAERAARMQAEVEEMIEVYGPACETLGYKRNDDKWRECIIKLAAKDERRYSRHPTTTTCFGHRGFFTCNAF